MQRCSLSKISRRKIALQNSHKSEKFLPFCINNEMFASTDGRLEQAVKPIQMEWGFENEFWNKMSDGYETVCQLNIVEMNVKNWKTFVYFIFIGGLFNAMALFASNSGKDTHNWRVEKVKKADSGAFIPHGHVVRTSFTFCMKYGLCLSMENDFDISSQFMSVPYVCPHAILPSNAIGLVSVLVSVCLFVCLFGMRQSNENREKSMPWNRNSENKMNSKWFERRMFGWFHLVYKSTVKSLWAKFKQRKYRLQITLNINNWT